MDQQGRVRSLATTTTLSPPSGRMTITDDLTFGGFGGPVSATAPPASEVTYTSTPYWISGF